MKKKIGKKILLVFIILSSVLMLKANVCTLEGIIIDEHNVGVPFAEVVVPQKNIRLKTGSNGRYKIEIELQSNNLINLEVYKKGYLVSMTSSMKLENTILKVPDIIMYKLVLEEIVVTATSTPKLYTETPVKTYVASKEKIERSGAQSVADALELFTGLRVEDNCQNCNFTQVRMNGMEGKYTQILIDGMPVVSSLAGVYALEQIPANMIRKLEVVKGGGSALYGGNAIAGVVNIITSDALNSGTRLSFSQEFISSKSNTNFNLNTSYVSKDHYTRITLFSNYQKRDHIDLNEDNFSDIGELNNISFGANFSHFFNDIDGKLKINFNSVFEDRRGGNKFDLPEHMADICEAIRTYRTDITVGWEQVFSKSAILKINSALSYTKRKSYYGSEQDINAYGNSKNPVIFTNLTYNNFALKDHNIILGLSYKTDTIEDSAPAYDRYIHKTYTDLGFFIQDEFSFFDENFSILYGMRGDKHSEIESLIYSPRVSLLFKGIENLTIRGTYSTGFRAPQVFDEDLHITQVGGEGMLIVNGNDLKEENSRSYTFGLDFGKQVKNKLYRFSIGVFYNKLTNTFTLRKIDSIESAMVFERFNNDSLEVYGMEFEAGFKIGGSFEIFTGWTFQKSKLEVPEPDFNSSSLFKSPDAYGSFRIDWNIKKLMNILLEMNYTGSMKIPHFAGFIEEDVLEISKAFTVFNISFSKVVKLSDKKMFVLSLTIYNFTNEYQKDLDKGVYRDAGYIYGPRIPRSLRLGVKFDF